MAYPKINDSGQSVELDLHGAPVRQATYLVENLVRLAKKRGRSSIKIIYGTSTSVDDPYAETVKHAVLDMLDSGSFDNEVSNFYTSDGAVTISIGLDQKVDRTKITIFDIDD